MVLEAVPAEDPVQGKEDGHLKDERQAGGKRVDFVLLVEAHHLLLHALFVVLEFLLDLLHLRLQCLQGAHALDLFVGEGDQHQPHHHREGDDRRAPAEARLVVEELQDRFSYVLDRLQDAGKRDHERASPWYWAGSTGPT